MVLGIGVDIVSITRVRDAVESSGRVFLDKVFTPWEQQRAAAHPDTMAYYAITFAAKEAIFKCFGIGWETGVKLTEIEIRDGEHGEPLPELSGVFARLARERDVAKVLLSLSYETEYAIASAALAAETIPGEKRKGTEDGYPE
ncbi:MAG: holo-ACP synthase [Chloroflexota bacterium]